MNTSLPSRGWPRPDLRAGQRVGLYGGSFDPIHVGHVDPVVRALEVANLDRVVYLPTGVPPHKDKVQASPLVRLCMVELALSEHPELLISAHELGSEPTYSIDTVRFFQREFPAVEFAFVIGADSFADLTKWREWRALVNRVDLVILARDDHDFSSPAQPRELLEELAAAGRSPVWVRDAQRRVSSTELRQLASLGRPLPEGSVSPRVLSFLSKYRPYGAKDSSESESSEESFEDSAQESSTATPALVADRPPPQEIAPIRNAAKGHPDESSETSASEESLPEKSGSKSKARKQPLEEESQGWSEPAQRSGILPPEVAFAARIALDRQAIDMRLLDVEGLCGFADHFLICTGASDRQVAAIADAIVRQLSKKGIKPLHVEGLRRANWVLVDFGDWIVHVFDPATRDFYRLERLWSDAVDVPNEKILAAEEPPDKKPKKSSSKSHAKLAEIEPVTVAPAESREAGTPEDETPDSE